MQCDWHHHSVIGNLLLLHSIYFVSESTPINSWCLHFQCLGDIFLKFCSQLRAYSNFLNNYPVKLQTLSRVSISEQCVTSSLRRWTIQSWFKWLSKPFKRTYFPRMGRGGGGGWEGLRANWNENLGPPDRCTSPCCAQRSVPANSDHDWRSTAWALSTKSWPG